MKHIKIEVLKRNTKQLLRPEHFITYGRSKFVQQLIRESSTKSLKLKYTKAFSIQFRDYLITSLVIGNGLRASNIIQLKLTDFDESTTVSGYEGHKVITNTAGKIRGENETFNRDGNSACRLFTGNFFVE